VTARLQIDDAGVTAVGQADPSMVAWADLVAVSIRTTGAGPFEDDLFWELTSEHGSTITVGSETEGVDLLLERLQRLPGFDHEAVAAASASTAEARFACWARRTVTLRDERRGGDVRWLGAYVDGAGALHIDGQDLGPGTAMVSSDGEYEWFETIAAADIPRLTALLGGGPGDDVLDLLARDWTGDRSYDLERLLRESDIPVKLFTWGG
jgi:hypothetical protein